MRILPDATKKRPLQGSPSLNNSAPRSKRRLLTRPANASISLSVRLANNGVFRSILSTTSFTGVLRQKQPTVGQHFEFRLFPV
jgi:hypothetical protein